MVALGWEALAAAAACPAASCGELRRAGLGGAHLDELALVEAGLLAEGVAAVDLVLVESDADDARAGELADVAAAAEVREWVERSGWAQQHEAQGARREAWRVRASSGAWRVRASSGAQRAPDAAAAVEHAIRLLQGRGGPTWSVHAQR